MKYVVTGGAGFIGSNLVNKLVKDNHKVYVIDNFSTGKKENCNQKAVYYNYDISDEKNQIIFQDIMQGSRAVFHLAALARVQPSILNPVKYEVNNSVGTVNILKAASNAKVKKFIYSSSSSVYGDTTNLPSSEDDTLSPMSPYANQKYYGELCCKMFSKITNIETVCLRYFNVFGEGQNLDGAYATVVGIFLNLKNKKIPLTINGSGNQKRDFTYVGDVVDANIRAASSNKIFKGDVFNVGSGSNISINELASLIGGKKIYNKAVDEPFANLASIEKINKILGWKPQTSIKSWLKDWSNH